MAPQHKRAGVRRLALGAAAVAASAALASGPVAGVGVARAADPRAPAPSPTTPVATPSALAPPAVPLPSAPAPATTPAGEEAPAFGVFLKSDARGVARMPLFSHWLGGAELRAGHTYLPGHRWRDIEGSADFLKVWAHWRNKKADRMLVLNVPMQERNEEGVSDGEVRWLLRQGAAGEFDHHFRVLAERLVELKVPDTVIVLGWEMNGTTYTHRCGPDPEAWKKYWNRIVTTMRSVPGQKFRFDFTPSRGVDAVPWTKCYPGDDTVDIIGMDSYDQPAGMSFEQQVKEPYGLQHHVDFAKAHGKPISYPEWGLFRNGDNAEYMRSMLAWMEEHKPLYNTLTDYCPHGVWQCGANPRSSHLYRSTLFGRTDQATPPLTPTPKPTPPSTPPPPADCTPLDLGSWVEEWLGGKLCLRFDWW
ncbi:glycoside hydrolase family 26 protein [Streptomyces coeruleorubidus]|uniref:Glycosyl hydrolase n=1 Tax=Streptomyces coeruleorubidus TaxID=116188 RepID=A0ABZ0KFQ0_STRC4|nr:glycosyl hydrolase [Streptomyces coeruleorubidus]WOT36789.1 glycosyl hydrolase [Streptomyces coeruleorubidus]